MKANRFFILLIIATLFAVTTLTVREAVATSAVISEVDSATRSYGAWAQSVASKASTVDSATRSYTAWAEAAEAEGNAVDSATRSYTAWAQSVESGVVPVTGSNACQTLVISPAMDSATQSYMAWARFLQCR